MRERERESERAVSRHSFFIPQLAVKRAKDISHCNSHVLRDALLLQSETTIYGSYTDLWTLKCTETFPINVKICLHLLLEGLLLGGILLGGILLGDIHHVAGPEGIRLGAVPVNKVARDSLLAVEESLCCHVLQPSFWGITAKQKLMYSAKYSTLTFLVHQFNTLGNCPRYCQ